MNPFKHIFYHPAVIVLFVLFVIANAAHVHRVPGLMGDEASEGENVFELLQAERIVVRGERSYIGPLVDYVRVPFVLAFGYSALALRAVMLLASVAVFFLASVVFRRLFGQISGLFALTAFAFSPIYLTYQRLGWAITLFPFFALLILYFMTSAFRHKWLLVGVAAGIGLHNHILFLPTIVGIGAGACLYTVAQAFRQGIRWFRLSIVKRLALSIIEAWPSLIGFAAGFGTQFAVLTLFSEDQGDPAVVAEAFGERLGDLPSLLPVVLSGSSYIARYTGMELSPTAGWFVAIVVLALALAALVLSRYKAASWSAATAIAVQLIVLAYVIDRFSLRYFVVPALGIWMLGGVGFGSVIARLDQAIQSRFSRLSRTSHATAAGAMPIIVALALTAWFGFAVLMPFLQSGGSLNAFSLGNRTDSAAALVDIRPLIACLRQAGPVYSENVHIWNRLQYLTHAYPDLKVVAEEDAQRAQWIVDYRLPHQASTNAMCPTLDHFSIRPMLAGPP